MMLLVAAATVGAFLSIQAGVNAQLRALLGDPVSTAVVSFVVGLVGLGLWAIASRSAFPVGTAWARSAWWQWTGGLLGAAYIAAMAVLAPRLGAGTLTAAVVAGQLVAALALDHFGWIGFPEHAVSPSRMAGAMLMMGGVLLIRR